VLVVAVSTFTWLDHRDDDQQRIRDALAAFDQPGIVDPLGLGVVRDAFSDTLFPGLSTVQTRARYFLLVPWVYRELDRRRVSARDGAQQARTWELQLIEALLDGSADKEGIIGRNSRAATKQLPSFIYWGGIARFGIRRFDGSRQEYAASLETRRRSGAADERVLWPGLPELPDGLFESTSLELSADEAEFLRDRIVATTRGRFLELLVRDGDPDQRADAPWEHPLAATAPANVHEHLHHARLFATCVWGAELLYNRELSRALVADGQAPLQHDYDVLLDDWIDTLDAMAAELRSWELDRLWDLVLRQNPRATGSRTFVDWWLARAIEDPRGCLASDEVRRRVRRREEMVKGPRAKLASRGARERSPAAQGGSLMLFRWPQAARIVGDIHEGLRVDA
jgi:hypothetical protein